MNLPVRQLFTAVVKRFSAKEYKHFENAYRPVYRNINLQAGCRKRITHEIFSANKQHFAKREDSIGVYGYFLLIVPVSTFVLGTWQIQRRKEKLELIEMLKTRLSAEPIEFPDNLEELESKEYYPFKVRGHFLYDQEFTVGPRGLIIDGVPASERNNSFMDQMKKGRTGNGYHVITPFKLENQDTTILVNRGWVPVRHRNAKHRESSKIEGTTEIIGVLRGKEQRPPFMPKNVPKDGVWYYRDVDTMAELAGCSPVYLDLISKNDPPGGPISGQFRVTLRNEHMSYIITWYSLSIITSYLWYRQFIHKLPLH